MSLEFKETTKDYYVLVNRPELAERAEQLGYESVMLFTNDDFDEDDLNHIKSANKPVVRISFNKGNDSYTYMRRSWFENTEIYNVRIELAGNEFFSEPDQPIETLNDAIKYFPTVERLEKELRNHAIIDEIEYVDMCGNCQAHLDKDDKYCKYCGTERGKGKFLPFRNETYCVYGPPIKTKYKCSNCGHMWITCHLGGDNSQYCPRCGGKTVNTQECKTLDFFNMAVGLEEPYDIGEEPVLLDESQIKELLDIRSEVIKDEEDSILDREHIYSAMRKAGISIPENADYDNYPRTEKEGEQINMAKTILSLRGNDYDCIGATCPHCGSKVLAAKGYMVKGHGFKEIASGVHIPVEGNPLVCNDGYINYDDEGCRKTDFVAYICLQCGKEFGQFKLPEEIEEKYNNFINTGALD